MKKFGFFFLLVKFVLVTTCQVATTDNPIQSFFDINDFLEQELLEISDLKAVKKIVSIDQETSEQILEVFDLEKDLGVFKNSNINKISWLDKYEVDSIFNASGQLHQLKYYAKEKKLKCQELVIFFEKQKVKSFSVKNSSSNQVSSLEQHLVYYARKGYSIESNQSVMLTGKQHLKVDVEYLFDD